MISTRMMRKLVVSLAERVGEHWRTNMDLSWKMLHLGKSQWPSSSQSMMEKGTVKHRRYVFGEQRWNELRIGPQKRQRDTMGQ